jgi:hypothetical protein
VTTGKSLTRQLHHDSGHVLIADFPLRGEYGALGRRLRRGQQCYSGVINALRAWNEISLARVLAISLVGKVYVLNLDEHRQGLIELVNE